MKRFLLALLFCLYAPVVWAGCSVGALPFILQNNTIADATQVMADFNQIIAGAASNCAGAGTNTDITNLNGLTLPNNTIMCNASGVVGPPQYCSGGQVANILGYCLIDGVTFPATIVGIQNAINQTSCHDIYIPAGTYAGSTALVIARSNIRLHGAGGIISAQGATNAQTASTILSFTCFSSGSSAVTVGDTSPTLQYGGIELSDFEILLPQSCNMNGLEVRASTPEFQLVRRVRITEVVGNTVGVAVLLDAGVYSWTFEDVTVDHFFAGYKFSATNHFTRVTGGHCSNNSICAMYQSNSASQNIVFDKVDIEGNLSYGFDIFSAAGWIIRDCFIDNGFAAGTRAVRIGAGTQLVEGVTITGNVFNNGANAQYAIELASSGFTGLHIENNHFNSYSTGHVLNNSGLNGSHGTYLANDAFFPGGFANELSSPSGFDIIHFGFSTSQGSLYTKLTRPGIRGTGVLNTQFGSFANLGGTPAVAVTNGSRDTVGEVTITPTGTPAANGTFVFTFQDGTWGQIPFCIVGNTGGINGVVRLTTRSATTLTVLMEGTWTSGAGFAITWNCWASQ